MPFCNLLDRISSDDNLSEAYTWLCLRRQRYSAHSDIWHLRRHWQTERIAIQQALRQGSYTFAPVQLYNIEGQIRRSLVSQRCVGASRHGAHFIL